MQGSLEAVGSRQPQARSSAKCTDEAAVCPQPRPCRLPGRRRCWNEPPGLGDHGGAGSGDSVPHDVRNPRFQGQPPHPKVGVLSRPLTTKDLEVNQLTDKWQADTTLSRIHSSCMSITERAAVSQGHRACRSPLSEVYLRSWSAATAACVPWTSSSASAMCRYCVEGSSVVSVAG